MPQPPLPPNPPLPSSPYPGADQLQPLTHLQLPQQMDTRHADAPSRRRTKRGKYHRKKSCWPQGTEERWRKTDRNGTWRRYIRGQGDLPHWCNRRLQRIYPGKDANWARQEWVRTHPKRRRTYRGGRQARDRRSQKAGARNMSQLEETGDTPDDRRRFNEIPYSCRGPTVSRDATGVPYAEEGSNMAPFRSGVSPQLPSIESQNGYQNNDDGIGDRDVEATGSTTRTSLMGEQGAVAAATSLLEQLAGLQPDLRILPPGSGCVDRNRKPGKPKHRRRFWRNRLKLKTIRNKARRRKRLRKTDVTMTLMRTRRSSDKVLKLTGQRSEPRMSFTHRLKIDGVSGRVVTQMKIVYANVRTLRERRKRGMSGDMNNSSTKNNWRIPALVRMMQKHGIFLAVLSETRRATKEVDVGQGYVLLTSQNAKVPWMGGVGILLSPADAEA